MKKKLRLLVMAGLVLSLGRCAHLLRNNKGTDDWDAHMSELGEIFSGFLPYLNSEGTLESAIENEKLKQEIETLRRLSSKTVKPAEPSGIDPGLPTFRSRFDTELRKASQALKDGTPAEALGHLRIITRQCMSCHALLENRPNPFNNDLPPNFERMSYSQRGDFYLGTLRSADAVYEFERGLLDPSWAHQNKREWNVHAQRLLSTVVRDRDNAVFTGQILKRFFETNSYPNDLRKYVPHWKRHVTEWKVEARQKRPRYKTPLAHAALLMDQAEKEAKLNGRNSVRVLALRASGILQRELSVNRSLASSPQFLYLSGLALTYLDDADLVALPEFYFERCVLLKNATTGKKCYAKLVEVLRGPG